MNTACVPIVRLLAVLVAVVCLGDGAGAQTIVRVRVGAPGPFDGTSWSRAFPTLQAAIDHVYTNSPTPPATEIWVAGHPSEPSLRTFRPTTGVGQQRTFRRFRGNLALYGGFAGFETARSQRNPAFNQTILSGDVDGDGTLNENAFSTISLSNLGKDTPVPGFATRPVFDGFFIQDGNAEDGGTSGSAADIAGGWGAVFVNCTFRNNRAGQAGLANGRGTVSIKDDGQVNFINCRFEDNESNNLGGALYIEGTAGASPVIADGCVFLRNRARQGGAMHTTARGVFFNNCRFEQNTAVIAGGALVRRIGAGLQVTGCDFIGNSVGVQSAWVQAVAGEAAEGGAVYLGSNNAPTSTVDVFTDCDFIGNSNQADPGAGLPWNENSNRGAGAVYVSNSTAKFVECRFTGNSAGDAANPVAVSSNAKGGAVRAIPGSMVTLLIDRCTFSGNTAPASEGGAVMMFNYPAFIGNSTFVANSALKRGSAVLAEVSSAGGDPNSLTVAGCLFHDNSCARTGEGAGALCRDSGANGVLAAFGNPSVINCTFVDNVGPTNAGLLIVRIGGNQLPDPQVANSVMVQNRALLSAPANAPYAANFYTDTSNPTYSNVVNNCIGGNYPVSNNFDVADPRFVDPANDNYRLSLSSPLVDGGSAARLPADRADTDGDLNTTEALPRDRDGNPRREDVPDAPDFGGGQQPNPDIGCYEAVPLVRQFFWDQAAGGLFGTGSNWRLGVAPDAGSAAVFDLRSNYTVTFGADAFLSGLELRSDGVTFDLGSRVLTVDGAPSVIGKRTDDVALFTLGSGSAHLASLRIGDGPRSDAGVVLSSPSSLLRCADGLVVGAAGDGRLSVSNGAYSSALTTTVGEQPGAGGLLSIVGAGSVHASDLLTLVRRGTVDVRSGGRLEAGLAGALLLRDSVLSGDGEVGGVVLNFGVVSPSSEQPTPTRSGVSLGTLTLRSGYQQIGTLGGGRDSGTLRAELGQGGNDRLEVMGNASLAGGLFVSLEPGFEPDPNAVDGNAYRATVLRADSIGQGGGASITNRFFDVALFPALTATGRYFRLEYAAVGGKTEVRVVQARLNGDVNTGSQSNFAASGSPTDAELVDLNKDGFPDLVLTIPADGAADNGNVTVLANLGNAPGGAWLGFASQTTVDAGGINPVDLDIADFDGDERLDVIVVNQGSGTYRVLLNTTAGVGGPISFLPRAPVPTGTPPGGVTALNYADTGGSMRTDAVLTVAGVASVGQVVPLLNLGGGTGAAWQGFAAETPINVGIGPTAIASGRLERFATGDPNGPDIAVANSGNPPGSGDTVSVLYNTGGASTPSNRFGRLATIRVGAGPNQIIIADLENDKETETLTGLFTINAPDQSGSAGVSARGTAPATGSVSVVRSLSTGQLSPAVTFEVGAVPSSVVVADLDRDGDSDLAVGTRLSVEGPEHVVRVLRNDTPGDDESGSLVLTERAPDIVIGDAPALVVSQDIDRDSDQDLVVINSETLSGARPGGGNAGGPRGVDESRVRVVPNAHCIGDFNGDRERNVADLTVFLGRFGQVAPVGSDAARVDINGDGEITTADLVTFLGRFGQACP